MKLMDISHSGPLSRFSDAQIYHALYMLSESDVRISRGYLSKKLSIGEGSTRTILHILNSWNCIDVTRRGIKLTDTGREILNEIPIKVVEVPASEDLLMYRKGAVALKTRANIQDCNIQKDSGIRAGATNAFIFFKEDSELKTKSNLYTQTLSDEYMDNLNKTVSMSEEDMLIVCDSPDEGIAMHSAISVALSVL